MRSRSGGDEAAGRDPGGATAAVVHPDPSRGKTQRLDERVFRTWLPGGTQVLSERMETVRSAAVGMWFQRGTAHEAPAERGIAHLLEHAVFKGTQRRSARDLAVDIEGVGGALDAYTTHEHTSFQARVPSVHLDRGLDVLTDLAFHPLLRESDVELEREVVLEEIARVEDTPEDLVFDLHAEFLYAGHPYGEPILGTRETLARIDADAVRRLQREAYTPANLIVAAAGCVEHDRLVESLARVLPAGETGPPSSLAAPDRLRSGERRVERPGGRQVHIVAGGPGVPYASPLRHAAVIVGTALGGGMSSRLFQRVREELGLAYSVFAFQTFQALGGHVGAYVGTRQETAAQARRVLEEELAAVAEGGIPEGELTAAREQLKGQLMLSLEGAAARMHRLAAVAVYGEPYRSLDDTAARIDAVTGEELIAAARLFGPERLAVLELWPA